MNEGGSGEFDRVAGMPQDPSIEPELLVESQATLSPAELNVNGSPGEFDRIGPFAEVVAWGELARATSDSRRKRSVLRVVVLVAIAVPVLLAFLRAISYWSS